MAGQFDIGIGDLPQGLETVAFNSGQSVAEPGYDPGLQAVCNEHRQVQIDGGGDAQLD